MSSIRNLKKDIDFLSSELLSCCLYNLQMSDKKHEKTIGELINHTISVRNDLKNKTCGLTKAGDSKKIKAEAKVIVDQLIKHVDDGFEKLGKLEK